MFTAHIPFKTTLLKKLSNIYLAKKQKAASTLTMMVKDIY
jgi:hypothetical protein